MALSIAIDANRYTDLCRGDEDALTKLRAARRIVLPFIVLAELRAGFRLGRNSTKNEQVLSSFLHSPRVELLFADEGTTRLYAAVFADLRAAGTPIPTNDVWIAALTLQHDLVLYSRDKHFDRIPRLPRI
jgi:tRNA(fMet)-specific endonuclease VapC